MSDVEYTDPIERLSRNLIEARLASAELGWPFVGYLIDMALAETKAAAGGSKRRRATRVPTPRQQLAARTQS
jgi:hypothetical protein